MLSTCVNDCCVSTCGGACLQLGAFSLREKRDALADAPVRLGHSRDWPAGHPPGHHLPACITSCSAGISARPVRLSFKADAHIPISLSNRAEHKRGAYQGRNLQTPKYLNNLPTPGIAPCDA